MGTLVVAATVVDAAVVAAALVATGRAAAHRHVPPAGLHQLRPRAGASQRRGKTSGRADDNEETIRKRLDVYHAQTSPLAAWYEGDGKRHAIKGYGDIQEINDALCAVIDAE